MTAVTRPLARNIELKARGPDRPRSLAACAGIGAEPQGLLRQRDTYFQAPHGRLKLREQEGARPHLIAYERLDRVEERESRYRIVELDDPEELKGSDLSHEAAQVVSLRRAFEIDEADLVAESYCDMVSTKVG